VQHKIQPNFHVSLSTRAGSFDFHGRRGRISGVWVGANLMFQQRIEAIVTMSAIADHTKRLSLGTICVVNRWSPRQDSNPPLMLRRKRREWPHLKGVCRHNSGRKTARDYLLIVELHPIRVRN